MAIDSSHSDAVIMLEYFSGESREFTEWYKNGELTKRAKKPSKKIIVNG